MTSEDKFILKHVEIVENDNSIIYNHDQLIPASDKRYTLKVEGNILRLIEGGNLVVFPAHQEPSEAIAFGFSALAFTAIIRPNDEDPLFVVIKRGEHLRAFPGKLAFPGGYMDSRGGQAFAAALCEFREETGDWVPYLVYKSDIALLDSVPTVKHHNITIISLFHTHMDDPIETIMSKMRIQKSEVADAYLLTFSQMLDRFEEFTPGLQKLLKSIEIDKKGNVNWKE